MYLYTCAIEFAPFGSEKNRRSRSTEIVDPSGDKVARPSPKSIYRIADKVCSGSSKSTHSTWDLIKFRHVYNSTTSPR